MIVGVGERNVGVTSGRSAVGDGGVEGTKVAIALVVMGDATPEDTVGDVETSVFLTELNGISEMGDVGVLVDKQAVKHIATANRVIVVFDLGIRKWPQRHQ